MTKGLTQVRKQEGKSPKGKGPKMAESTLVSSQEGDQSVEKSGLNVEREFLNLFHSNLGMKSAAGFIAAPATGPKARP